jgi:hypothetical protein
MLLKFINAVKKKKKKENQKTWPQLSWKTRDLYYWCLCLVTKIWPVKCSYTRLNLKRLLPWQKALDAINKWLSAHQHAVMTVRSDVSTYCSQVWLCLYLASPVKGWVLGNRAVSSILWITVFQVRFNLTLPRTALWLSKEGLQKGKCGTQKSGSMDTKEEGG